MSPYAGTEVFNNGQETIPSANPVLTVAASYVTGDYVGTSGVAMIFTGCAPVNGGAGWVLGAKLIDKNAANLTAGELWLFTTAVTPPADSAAWTISDADAANLVVVIPFAAADYFASALNSTVDGRPVNGPKRYVCASGSTNLYGCFVTRGSPTYASLDLLFILSLLQD